MESVIVQRPAERGRDVPPSWSLRPGDAVRFGRSGVDIELADPGVPRLAGEISASQDFWLLTNFAREDTYVVENPQGGGEFVKVAPGRAGAPIPFEFSRLMIPVTAGTIDLLVLAPEHGFLEPAGAREGEPTAASFSLDETARYFQVLLALCEPRLREPSSAAVPSDAAVAQRLHGPGDPKGMTAGAVGFHVRYLAERKLHLRERERDDHGPPPERLEHTREALVALALRFDLVREEHLRLLPSKRP